jgi:hypothetical protein
LQSHPLQKKYPHDTKIGPPYHANTHKIVFLYSCRWVKENIEVVRLERGKFEWHRQPNIFFYWINVQVKVLSIVVCTSFEFHPSNFMLKFNYFKNVLPFCKGYMISGKDETLVSRINEFRIWIMNYKIYSYLCWFSNPWRLDMY